jgi:uncharacterized membrane protein
VAYDLLTKKRGGRDWSIQTSGTSGDVTGVKSRFTFTNLGELTALAGGAMTGAAFLYERPSRKLQGLGGLAMASGVAMILIGWKKRDV